MHRLVRPRSLVVVATISLAVLVGACTAATPTAPPTATAVPPSTPNATQAPTPTTAPASIVPVPSEAAAASPTVTSAEVCADLAAFQSSIDTLKGLDMSTARVPTVVQAVGGAITTGTALVDSSKAAFGPEAQALATALSGLQSALTGITGEGTLLDKAATIEDAIDDVAAAFDALKAELTPGCPSAEPSGG